VDINVRLSDEAKTLTAAASAHAKVLRKGVDGKEIPAALVPLALSPRQNKLLEGKVRDLPPGAYRVEIDSTELPAEAKESTTGPALFMVLGTENAELLDLSTDPALLQNLAEQSGGRVFTPENVEQLLDVLSRKVQPKETRQDSRPWRDEPGVWWLLALLIGLLTLEWSWRKWLDLP
jgi:hypothetical protein